MQKSECKVCLKRWYLDYDSMLQLLDLQLLSACRQYLKLTTTYNITTGNSYFPPDIFIPSNFPYSCNHHLANYTRPFARSKYMYVSFIPSVISTWNSLPYNIKTSPTISTFKRSLLYHFSRLMYHIICCYSCCLLSIEDTKKFFFNICLYIHKTLHFVHT